MLCTGKPFRFDRTVDGTDVDGAQAAGELGDAQHVAVDDLLRLMRAEPAVAVEEAIAACERDASLADSWVPHVYLVAAYALLGNVAKVQGERAQLLTQRPAFSINDFKALRVSDVPAYLQRTEAHLYAGLRKAGIPEN